MFIQRRINVDATSWRCIDVIATLYKRNMLAGLLKVKTPKKYQNHEAQPFRVTVEDKIRYK